MTDWFIPYPNPRHFCVRHAARPGRLGTRPALPLGSGDCRHGPELPALFLWCARSLLLSYQTALLINRLLAAGLCSSSPLVVHFLILSHRATEGHAWPWEKQKDEALQSETEELTQREEEIVRQNEELQAQAEELERRSEEFAHQRGTGRPRKDAGAAAGTVALADRRV